MLVARPLIIMLRVLGWAALPLWAASLPVAFDGTGRELMWVLATAVLGTCCALALAVLARVEKLWRQRDAHHERLERDLCGVIREELRPYGAAMTRPDLRVVPGFPELRVVRLGARLGGAQARQ
jgi:hypothetical protein